MQHLEAIAPQGAVPRLEVPRPTLELRKVEEEVDLDVPLVAAQVGEPASRRARAADERDEGATAFMVTSSA